MITVDTRLTVAIRRGVGIGEGRYAIAPRLPLRMLRSGRRMMQIALLRVQNWRYIALLKVQKLRYTAL